jgi:hypothetical protein
MESCKYVQVDLILNLNINIYDFLNIIVLAKSHYFVILRDSLNSGLSFTYIYPEISIMALLLNYKFAIIIP